MGTAYGDGGFIVFHHLSQKLRTGKTGDAQPVNSYILRVVGMDGAGKYRTVDIGSNVGCTLTVKYGDALLLQGFGKGRNLFVGAGNLKAFFT